MMGCWDDVMEILRSMSSIRFHANREESCNVRIARDVVEFGMCE